MSHQLDIKLFTDILSQIGPNQSHLLLNLSSVLSNLSFPIFPFPNILSSFLTTETYSGLFVENVVPSLSISTGLDSVQEDLEAGQDPCRSQRSQSPTREEEIDEALEQHLLEMEMEEVDSYAS